ncbi:ABC transporter substrate-binding protein [Microvirga antarctica]|uniref:ABC transporter substrate-binding protein n=1 Tax=Microvirga antarctica TaxID=2819233 RepID=UPI001B30E67A|nr:ABC transporter substrate-binding protein [Microvirga antarctica]
MTRTILTNQPPSRRTVIKGGIAASSVALAGVSATVPAQAADREIRLGFVGPVTGTFAELGTAMRDGAQVAVDAINAGGGVKVGDKTYTITMVIGDEEATPERALAATRRLIDVEGVTGILGYANSTNLLATMPLLQDSRIPMIDTSGRADSIPRLIAEKKMDYLFQLSPVNNDFVGLHGDIIKHYGKADRVGILAFNTDFAREYTVQADKLWPEMIPGVKIEKYFVEVNKMDLQPELLQIRRFKPQFLWVLLTGPQSYQFVDQFHSSGMIKTMLVLGDSIYGSDLFRSKNGNKVDYHMANAITQKKPVTALTIPFYDAFSKKVGFNPPYYAVQTYDGMIMMLEGLTRMAAISGDVKNDRTALRDALVSIDAQKPVIGARGSLAFSSLETGRRVPVTPVVTQYQPDNVTDVAWPLAQAGKFLDPRS